MPLPSYELTFRVLSQFSVHELPLALAEAFHSFLYVAFLEF